MAFYRKLEAGWRLTDGILPDMELDRPLTVYEALRENGQIRAAEIGLNAMACEWISARRWVCSALVEAPQEGDDRTYIELPKVSGSGAAYLNGECIASFETGAARMDVTGKLKEDGENRLEIRFEPALYERPGHGAPLPVIGLLAAPVLRTANYVAVERISMSARMDGMDGVLEVSLDAEVYAEGTYTFRYALMSGEGDMTEKTVAEELSAGRHELKHEIRVERAVPLDNDRLEDTAYSLKFTLERGGVGCDVRHMETAFRRENPARCFAVRSWPVPAETIERMKKMGADGIVMSGMPENAFEKNDYLNGLTVLEAEGAACAVGMVSAVRLEEYAAGEECWPTETAIWRLRGGNPEADGSGLTAEKFALAMRLHQANCVFQASMRARKEKKPFIAQWDEEFAYFTSDSLIEKDGSERPALRMLQETWQEAYACCELPESGCARADAPLLLSIWAMAEALRGQVLSASVSIMDMKGQEIASTRFPVMGGDVRMAGVIGVRTPEKKGLLIIRTGLHGADGSLIRQLDSVLSVGDDQAVRQIGRAGTTRLAARDAKTVNEGECAALSAGLCLMPGEETEITGVEWLNA